ncbi:MAG: glycosyltransferase family 4 protein [Armatimonadota bacterium]
MKTVMHVLNMNPDKHGVLELLLLEMAQQLTDMGWRQVVVFNNEPQQWMKEWSSRTGGTMLGIPDPSASGISQIIDIANHNQADVVHIHLITARALYDAMVHAGHGNIVHTVHSFRKPQRFEIVRRLYRHYTTRCVKHFIAVSDYIYHQARRDYLLPASRITTVLNGIDTRYYTPRDDKFMIRKSLFNLGSDVPIISIISHLASGKRLDMLVKAMPMVLKQVPDAQLIIAGGGSERPKLENLVVELGLQNHARVISSDNKTELIYAASDVCVLPSEGEGIAGSAIEAMACGLPLICTPNGGLAEVAEHGVSGLHVTNQTAEGLAEAIIQLMTDHELRQRMGIAARQRVLATFDVRDAARKTIDIYKHVLSE